MRIFVVALIGSSVGCGASAPPAVELKLAPRAAAPQPVAVAAPAEPEVTPALAVDAITPTSIAAPPFERTLVAPTRPMPAERAPELVQLRMVKADPARSVGAVPYRADAPFFLAPADNGALPAGARADIPAHYAGEGLRAIIPSGEHLLLVYGGRYLVVIRGEAVLHAFDLEGFRHPPRANPKWEAFALQDLTYAQIASDTLYVCNGGGSYARDVDGKKGFVSAIDLATGALRWRSDPLVCNATFAVYGEYLIAGYGFTAEPDALFVLRLADGQIVGKKRLATGPDTLTLTGNQLRVETYGHSYDFALK